MRASWAVFAACIGMALSTLGCGGGGGGSNYQIAYTYGEEQIVRSVGLDEAGGKPHGEVYASEIDMLACDGRCTRAEEPLHWVELFLDSDTVGSTTGEIASSDFENEEITVEVTRVDADGGVIEGTFTGTTVTQGSFRVRRNDAVGFFMEAM